MGLCLSVGFMAELKENDPEGYEDFKATLDRVSQALVAEGLPPHHEPETVGPSDAISFDMFGYSGLHYLRRIAAHLTYSEKLPSPGNKHASEDELQKKYYDEACGPSGVKGLLSLFKKSREKRTLDFNHLMLHSDCEGFYLPVEFSDVIFPASTLEIPGEMVGSAQRLLKECRRLAAELAIPHDVDAEGSELWDAADQQGEGLGWKAYGVESLTCVRLMRACEASIRSGAALVFA